MTTGGFAPGPWRTGPSRGQTLEQIVRSLLAARGTAFERVDTRTAVFVECMAQGRVLWEAWETNARAQNQWDPDRMTDFLPRWEKIFQIVPPTDATRNARRAVVKRRFQNIGRKLTIAGLNSLIRIVYPDIFVEITNSSSSTALSHTPVDVSIPGGVTITGDGTWGSSIHHVAIHVEQPATMTDADFYRQAGELFRWIEPLLPAYDTIGWYRHSSAGVIGFRLDDPHNLDNEAFDS